MTMTLFARTPRAGRHNHVTIVGMKDGPPPAIDRYTHAAASGTLVGDDYILAATSVTQADGRAGVEYLALVGVDTSLIKKAEQDRLAGILRDRLADLEQLVTETVRWDDTATAEFRQPEIDAWRSNLPADLPAVQARRVMPRSLRVSVIVVGICVIGAVVAAVVLSRGEVAAQWRWPSREPVKGGNPDEPKAEPLTVPPQEDVIIRDHEIFAKWLGKPVVEARINAAVTGLLIEPNEQKLKEARKKIGNPTTKQARQFCLWSDSQAIADLNAIFPFDAGEMSEADVRQIKNHLYAMRAQLGRVRALNLTELKPPNPSAGGKLAKFIQTVNAALWLDQKLSEYAAKVPAFSEADRETTLLVKPLIETVLQKKTANVRTLSKEFQTEEGQAGLKAAFSDLIDANDGQRENLRKAREFIIQAIKTVQP